MNTRHTRIDAPYLKRRSSEPEASDFERLANAFQILVVCNWWGIMIDNNFRMFDVGMIKSYLHSAYVLELNPGMKDDFECLYQTVLVIYNDALKQPPHVYIKDLSAEGVQNGH